MKRLLPYLCAAPLRVLLLLLACLAPVLPVRAENVYIMSIGLTGIYSVDITTGGPATLLTPISPPPDPEGYTLATRPSDGMLFFLDTENANPNLWRWDPSTPSVPPSIVGTPGATTTGIMRLGFDASDRLLAINNAGNMWVLDTTTGGILSTITLTGSLPTQSGDLCLNSTNGTMYMVANQQLYTLSNAGLSTLLGNITGVGELITGCAFTRDGTLLVSGLTSNNLYRVNLTTRAATALPNTHGVPSNGTGRIGDLATAPQRSADLSLTMVADNTTPATTVSYTITITNAGPAPVTDPRVVDQLPAGLTFTSFESSQGTYSVAAVGSTPANTWRVGPLLAGQSATLTLYATVTTTGSKVNTAQVSYSDQYDPDSVPNNNVATEDDQASVTIVPSPDLKIEKKAQGSFAVGANGTYSLVVSNAGLGPTSGTYTVTDVLAPTLDYIGYAGTNWTCTWTAGTRTVSCGSSTVIAGGATSPNPLTLTVRPLAGAAPFVSNTASVIDGGEPVANRGNNGSTVSTPVCDANCPDLRVNKTLSTTSLTAGTNTSVYTLSVTNHGGLATTAGYILDDVLPAGLTLAAAPTPNGWTCTANVPAAGANVNGGNRVSCTHPGPLAPGATSPAVTFPVLVGIDAAPEVINRAMVSGGGEPPATAGNNETSLTTPVLDFDLTLTKVKTGGGNLVRGANATYTFTVVNTGGRASTGTYTLTDTLPAGLTIRSTTPTNWTLNGWTCATTGGLNTIGGTAISCTNTTAIAANGGTSPQLVVPVTVGNTPGGSVTNEATVSSATEATNLRGNNKGTVTNAVDAPDLVITKSHNGAFALNTAGTYTITVTNIGAVATSGNITVTDTLPAGFTFGSATGTDWTCSAAAGTVTCTRTLALGASTPAPPITLTVTPTASANPTSVNVATVAGGNEPAWNAGANNSASDTTVIPFPPSVAKSFNPTSIPAGGTSRLTLTISTPNALAPLQGVNLVDNFPAGMVVDDDPALSNTCGGTITAGSSQGDAQLALAGGSTAATSCTIQVNVTVTGATGNRVNTTGNVSSNAGVGNTASATLGVTAPTVARLTKLSSPNVIGLGQTSVLTFTINNKNTTTNNMAFRDTLPTGLVVASATPVSNTCTDNNNGGAAVIAAPAGGNVITVTGLDLDANQSCVIAISIRGTAAGTYNNTTANISYPVTGTSALNYDLVDDTLVVQAARLTKAFAPSSMLVSGTSTLTLTITNGAAAPAQGGMAFTENLPTGLRLAQAVTASQCGGTVTGAINATAIGFTGGTLAAGVQSCTITAVVTTATAGDYVNDAARIAGITNLENGVNATLTVTPRLADLLKTNNQTSITPGDTTTYVITVGNSSGAAFSGLVLKDPAVANLSVTSAACAAQGGATCPALASGAMVTALQSGAGLSIGAMPNGSSLTFTLGAQLSGNPSGTLTNVATATVTGGGTTTAQDSDTIVYPGLVSAKTVAILNDPVNGTTNPKNIPGAEVLYTITVSNTGEGRVDNDSVLLADAIPAATVLFVGNLGGTPAGPFTYADAGTGLTFTYTSLASVADDVEFSNNNGSTWVYTPVPDASGYDTAVTNVRLRPKGRMAGWSGSGPYPTLTFTFKARIR